MDVTSELAKQLGKPEKWNNFTVFELATWKQVDMKLCPQCGAAVLNPYQHKAWHLQNEL